MKQQENRVNGQQSDELTIPHYSLTYGMRLEKGATPEMTHPHVKVILPDGSAGDMALHVINGTADEIRAQLLESVDAFFDIYFQVDTNTTCRR